MPDKNKRNLRPRPVVLVIDVGGSNIKLRKSDGPQTIKFKSGPKMTPGAMVAQSLMLTTRWSYDVVSIGFPGPVIHGQPSVEPENLGEGWTKFNFRKAFRKPLKIINDAAMQALGTYTSGRMLFLGLGTGLGSALIVDEIVVPLELGELRYDHDHTLEDIVGKDGLKKRGRRKWEAAVHKIAKNLKTAFVADFVVVGGGNAKRLHKLPKGAQRGSNRYAFRGGVRLWRKSPLKAEQQKHVLIMT